MAQVKSHGAVLEREREILERGDIYFLYRPRVGADEAHGLRDVERFYILLKRWHRHEYRLLIIGRKRPPDPGRRDRF